MLRSASLIDTLVSLIIIFSLDVCKRPNKCSQICQVENGSAKCSCKPGYRVSDRNINSCKAEGSTPNLIYSTREKINGLSLKSFRPFGKRFPSSLTSAIAVDVDVRNGIYYFSDINDEKIFRFLFTITESQMMHPLFIVFN